MTKKSIKKSKRRKRSKRSKSKCRKYLQDKISINMGEYKKGKFSSRKQALAVSYSQVKKKSPGCKRFFSRRK